MNEPTITFEPSYQDEEVTVQHGTINLTVGFTITERTKDTHGGNYPPSLMLELDGWIGEQIAEAYKKATGRELLVQIYGRDYT